MDNVFLSQSQPGLGFAKPNFKQMSLEVKSQHSLSILSKVQIASITHLVHLFIFVLPGPTLETKLSRSKSLHSQENTDWDIHVCCSYDWPALPFLFFPPVYRKLLSGFFPWMFFYKTWNHLFTLNLTQQCYSLPSVSLGFLYPITHSVGFISWNVRRTQINLPFLSTFNIILPISVSQKTVVS